MMHKLLTILIFLSFTSTTKSQTLTVMTYNIHHANPPSHEKDSLIDLKAIATVINNAKPDLVALQEIDANNGRAGMDINEAKELARLTGMNYYFTRSIWFRDGAYGNAVLSRLPIRDTMRYELPAAPGVRAETRSLCMIRVQLKSGKELLFASTHLDQHRDDASRMQQARVIADVVRKTTIPCIIGGDFNAGPESAAILMLDSVMTRSCKTDCPLTIPTENPKKTIDYIWYAPAAHFESKSVRTIPETYASDHLPVLAEIRVL